MIAAIRRKVYEVLQVINLHSALSKSNMQVHNLRKAGDGRYFVRVSASPNSRVALRKALDGKTSPFANTGLMARVSGSHERMRNENKFAGYFEEAMASQAIELSADGDDTGMELAAYTEFEVDRKITTRKAADWGLRAMLRNFGCDVDQAELVSDAGYGSHWLAVAFAAA